MNRIVGRRGGRRRRRGSTIGGLVVGLSTLFAVSIGETLLTKAVAASRTVSEAVAAEPVVAAVTRATALGTEIPLAVGTHPAAVGAQSDFTRVAVVGVAAPAGVAAVRTTLAIPVREPDVGTAHVIGLQHLLHEQKEITKPSLSQRIADRHAPIPVLSTMRKTSRLPAVGTVSSVMTKLATSSDRENVPLTAKPAAVPLQQSALAKLLRLQFPERVSAVMRSCRVIDRLKAPSAS